MKIVVTHSSDLDFENVLYKPLQDADFWDKHEIFLPHQTGLPEQITQDMIRDADLVLCEVSLPSTGQGIEIGWATSFSTPVVCFYKKGSKISGSLRFVCDTFFEYSDPHEMIEKIREYLV